MSKKVIYVNKEIHKKAKDYCESHNIGIGELIENLILSTVENYKSPVIRNKVVEDLDDLNNNIDLDIIWSKPPFWEDK